jgi:hypothetical protein
MTDAPAFPPSLRQPADSEFGVPQGTYSAVSSTMIKQEALVRLLVDKGLITRIAIEIL